MNINNIINKIIKQSDLREFFSKYFSFYFTLLISPIAIKLKISPNLITLTMIPLAIIGNCLLFFNQNIHGVLLVCGCYILLNIIDTVDGQVARHLKKTSNLGKNLDYLCHFIADSLLIISLIFFSFKSLSLEKYQIYVSFLFLIIYCINFYIKLSFINIKKKIYNILRKNIYLYYIKDTLHLNGFVHIFPFIYFITSILGLSINNNVFIYIILFYLLIFFINNLTKLSLNLKFLSD
jgi:phosphatidylglycerophosphate synthase